MSNYEFSKEDNVVFDALSKRMAHFGILTMITGTLSAIGGIGAIAAQGFAYEPAVGTFLAIVLLIIGITIYRPTDNLRRIAKTEGSDIEELMTALKEFNNGFGIVFVLVLVNVAFVLYDIVIWIMG